MQRFDCVFLFMLSVLDSRWNLQRLVLVWFSVRSGGSVGIMILTRGFVTACDETHDDQQVTLRIKDAWAHYVVWLSWYFVVHVSWEQMPVFPTPYWFRWGCNSRGAVRIFMCLQI